MAVISLKAKVLMISESDMELDNRDMGMEYKSAKWVWKLIGIEADDIYRIITYNSKKSLIIDLYGEKTLIDEPFYSVFKKWQENKTQDLDLSEEIEEDEEKDDEDEN